MAQHSCTFRTEVDLQLEQVDEIPADDRRRMHWSEKQEQHQELLPHFIAELQQDNKSLQESSKNEMDRCPVRSWCPPGTSSHVSEIATSVLDMAGKHWKTIIPVWALGKIWWPQSEECCDCGEPDE